MGKEELAIEANALDSSRGLGMTGGAPAKGVGYWGADSRSMVWMSVVGKWCWEASAMARSLVSIGAWMGASGLAECLADQLGDGDTLASGKGLDFSVFRVVQEDL